MEENFNLNEHTHRRLNLLTGEWVMVSPHRTKRPWLGKTETVAPDTRPQYDPACYLCPGNSRAEGVKNPPYTKCYAFDNDFASLLPDTPMGELNDNGLLIAESQRGFGRVITFSPRHDLTLPELSALEILDVVELLTKEFKTLKNDPTIKYIQIFENKGDVMGCSNPHPHGQIWAQNSIPVEVAKETLHQKQYFEQHGKSLLSAYLELELQRKDRVVFENEHFAVLVPFWAVWPYETIIISKRHVGTMLEFSEEEKLTLAKTIKKLTTLYDNLFETSFPYSAGMHQSPVNDGDHSEWHWHMHFYPPLLRSATVKKFMVGYEMLANPQRDITPEFAADRLRNMSSVHYKMKNSAPPQSE